MAESTNINLPKTMPLSERISEAEKLISKWITSLKVPFDGQKDDIRLIKYERDNKEYSYNYIIARDVNIATRKRQGG